MNTSVNLPPPEQKEIYEEYCSKEEWTIQEAAALTVGYCPIKLDILLKQPVIYILISEDKRKIECIKILLKKIKRAVDCGQLASWRGKDADNIYVRPHDFLDWIKKIKPDFLR